MLKFSGYSYLISGHSLENLEKFALLLELREANTNATRSRLAFFYALGFRLLSDFFLLLRLAGLGIQKKHKC